MKKKTKLLNALESIFAIIVCIALVLSLTLAGDLLMPRRWDYGGTWDMYLQEQENTIDVMFFGTSLAYCDVVPARIYENTGLTAYVMAGPAQTPEQTYYYVREALKTQSPQAIFVEASAAFASHDLFPHVNVGYMPWTLNRLAATFTCEKEEWTGLLFPLYSYHSRFVEPSEDAYRPVFNSPLDDWCGYTYLDTVTPIEEETYSELWADASTSGSIETGLEYFGKISEYCAERGIELVFYFTPLTNHSQDADMETLKAGLSELRCAGVYDYSYLARDIGINYETDWYDDGHLNFSGAVKFTDFISVAIAQLGLEPSGTADSDLWAQRVEKVKEKI